MIGRLALLSSLLFVATGCVGKRGSYDDVGETMRSRTGLQVALPDGQISPRDVERHVSGLLTRSLTATSAAQVALLNNPRVRATLEELNLSQADLLEASLPSNPSLAASVRWPSNGGGNNPEVGLAGDVLNWLLLPLRSRMAMREYAAAKRRVSHELMDVVYETKEAFYELQAQQQVLERLQTAAEVNSVSSDIARRLREAGNITALELLKEETGSQQAQLELTRTRGELAAAREKLNRAMGLTTSQGMRWKFAPALPALPGSEPSLNRIEAAAVANRQDLAAQRETLEGLEQGYALARKTRLIPALNLGINVEKEPDGERLRGPTLDVEVPLFNQGLGRTKKAEAQRAQALAQYEALELEVRSDVRQALQQVQTARQLYQQISATLVPQRQKILEQSLLQYNAMQISNFELLQAKANRVEAEREQVEALRDYWVARAGLEKAAGGSLTVRSSTTTPKRAAAPHPAHVH
jgi:cobalt-zinc-cadmium efflux system outer membrane protein